MKNRIIKIVFVVVLSITMHQTCFAGLPIGIGRVLLVPTYTRYTASSYWNDQGQLKANPAGTFQSSYFGLYGGFGIGRDLDLIFNIPYVTNRLILNGVSSEPLSTSGDITVGLSYFLNHYDYYKHLSVTGSLIIPTYTGQNLPADLIPGFGSTGAEIKIGLAGTNTTSFKDSYYDMEAGVRSYFNTGAPTVLFANATLGVPLGEQKDWKISGTLNVVSASSNTAAVASTNSANQFINTNFSYLRATLGIGRKVDRHVEIWAAIFKDIIGRNIGQGSGFSIYGVFSF